MKLFAIAVALTLFRQDDKITLKFTPKQGDKVIKSQKMEMRVKATVEFGEQTQEIEIENKAVEMTRTEYLEVADGKVTKSTIDYLEDYEERKQPPTMEWNRTDNPMHGRKITLTLKDGQVVREGVDGLTEKLQNRLTLDDASSRHFPKQAVGVGDRWEVKGEELSKLFGAGDDLKDGIVKLKLNEIKEIDKRRCALIKADIDLKGKGPNNVDFGLKMEADIVVWIERGHTLSIKGKGTMTMKAQTEQFSMAGEGPMTFEITMKVE